MNTFYTQLLFTNLGIIYVTWQQVDNFLWTLWVIEYCEDNDFIMYKWETAHCCSNDVHRTLYVCNYNDINRIKVFAWELWESTYICECWGVVVHLEWKIYNENIILWNLTIYILHFQPRTLSHSQRHLQYIALSMT